MDLTPNPERPATEPSRKAAYDAVYEVIRQRPPRSTDDYDRAAENARVWRAVEVALAAALPIERRAGREDAAEAIQRVAESTRESLISTPPEYVNEANRHRIRAQAFERAVEIARGGDAGA